MKYQEIIETIAKREKTSVEAIESAIKTSLAEAGLNCTPKDFIECMARYVLWTIYS